MTGNVAQVFITDQGWAATLGAVREALRPEVRDAPDRPGRECVFTARRAVGEDR